MTTWMFWIGIILMIDASIGLWGESYWKRLTPGLHIRMIAFIELGVAVVLIAASYLLR